MGQNYKNKKRLLIAITAVLSLIFCISLSLFCYQTAYANRIMRNVYFNGVNIEGQTRVQAKTIIQTDTDPLLNNKIVTKSGVGKEYAAAFSQTGISFDVDQAVNSAFSVGRSDSFFQMLFLLSKTAFVKTQISVPVVFDNTAYQSYLASTQNSLSLPPVDASLSISNGQIITTTGTNGVTVDASGLKNQIAKTILTGEPTVSIEVPTTPITPTLQTENLANAKTIAENYLTHQITLTVNGNTYSIDSGTIASWISFGLQNGTYSAWLNSTAIKSYINTIASKNDVAVIDTKISAVDNTTVLQQGRQGVYIDQADTLTKITAALNSAITTTTIALVQTTKDPQTITVFPDEGIVPGRFPGQYIDVDLTSQLMTLFNGTTQVQQFQVSTGKASTPTPVGTRTVQGHNPMAWSTPYSLWMPWFMSIGDGYGIHELPRWPDGIQEVTTHLGVPLSDGCIRLGVGPAEFVYNWTPDGTPVYIHK
jgi:vancomycin resistance protein YoaR